MLMLIIIIALLVSAPLSMFVYYFIIEINNHIKEIKNEKNKNRFM